MKNLPNKFIFSHSGDPSVGINGESMTVEYDGEIVDEEYHQLIVETLTEAFQTIFDNTRVRVTPEHEHTCSECKEVVKHLEDYCDLPFYCSDQACITAGIERRNKEEAEEAQAQETYWNSNLNQQGSVDTDAEYFRSRNERTLRGINGAGIRG